MYNYTQLLDVLKKLSAAGFTPEQLLRIISPEMVDTLANVLDANETLEDLVKMIENNRSQFEVGDDYCDEVLLDVTYQHYANKNKN